MSTANTAMIEKYRNNFLKEVEANVEEGDWVKMCMQCGVCSGSCPLGPAWDHPPQEIFMMIRAGKRDEVLGRIEKNLTDAPLSGFVLEGMAPYATADAPTVTALRRAALSGMPVARVGRGSHEAFTPVNTNDLFIEGSNLTAPKARMLLMACLLRFGALPLPADRDNPTAPELDAIRAKVAIYQAVFDTH